METEWLSNNIIVKLTLHGQVSSPINKERGKLEVKVRFVLWAYIHKITLSPVVRTKEKRYPTIEWKYKHIYLQTCMHISKGQLRLAVAGSFEI